jgi:hypothetical protein
MRTRLHRAASQLASPDVLELAPTLEHDLRIFPVPGLHEEGLFCAIVKLRRDLPRRCRARAASACRGHSRFLGVQAEAIDDGQIELHIRSCHKSARELEHERVMMVKPAGVFRDKLTVTSALPSDAV